VGEIDATLLTFKIRSERLVWGKQSGEPAVSGRPGAAANDRQLSGPPIAYPKSEWHAAKQAASAAPSRLQERSCMRSGFEHSG